MNFLSLRTGEDAQWEIKMFAQAIEKIFAEVMPWTYQAWVNNERIAP
jgi:thymidylate synthase (FAD)